MQRRIDQIQLDEKSFLAIAAIALTEIGLTLAQEKTTMIQSRLRHRLRALNFDSFELYSRFLCSDAGQGERQNLISALTTNVSHFFREPHHFTYLRSQVLENHLPRLRKGGTLRIWSAGCSYGQEPLSIAMSLLNLAPEIEKYDFRILATDVDTQVIRFCRHGVYDARMLTSISDADRKRHFRPTTNSNDMQFEVTPMLRQIIRYKDMNLLANWPMKRGFDFIFCRNVVIYFDPQIQAKLWPRFGRALLPTGHLILGHSERITDPAATGFRVAGPTSYAKVVQ